MRIKYTKELLEEVVRDNTSIAGVIRQLGLKLGGGTQAHIGRKLKEFDIDISHFTGQAHRKGKTFKEESKPFDYYLVKLPEGSRRTDTKYLKRALIESGIAYECLECGLGPEWQGKSLTLQVDHIDGDWYNNRRENLRFLCPNCHCQTETWGRIKRP